MKKIFFIFCLFASVTVFYSCGSDDDTDPKDPDPIEKPDPSNPTNNVLSYNGIEKVEVQTVLSGAGQYEQTGKRTLTITPKTNPQNNPLLKEVELMFTGWKQNTTIELYNGTNKEMLGGDINAVYYGGIKQTVVDGSKVTFVSAKNGTAIFKIVILTALKDIDIQGTIEVKY